MPKVTMLLRYVFQIKKQMPLWPGQINRPHSELAFPYDVCPLFSISGTAHSQNEPTHELMLTLPSSTLFLCDDVLSAECTKKLEDVRAHSCSCAS